MTAHCGQFRPSLSRVETCFGSTARRNSLDVPIVQRPRTRPFQGNNFRAIPSTTRAVGSPSGQFRPSAPVLRRSGVTSTMRPVKDLLWIVAVILLLAAIGCADSPSSDPVSSLTGPGGSSTPADAPPSPLAVTLAADASTVPVGTVVTFTAGQVDGVGPFAYAWDFGAGAAPVTTGSPVVGSRYDVAGVYSASVVIRDALAKTGSATQAITVEANPDAPPPEPAPPAPVVLEVRVICAVGGKVATCTTIPLLNGVGAFEQIAGIVWTWSDGTITESPAAVQSHTYAPGPIQGRSVSVAVTMTTGHTGTASAVFGL
jgi:hypothetical protein